MIFLTLVVLGVDVAPRPPPSCTADGDCIISTYGGCCGACCPPPPHAVSRDNDAARRRRCAAVDCEAPRCADVKCAQQEPASAYRAVCRSGQCVAVRAAAAPLCQSDADCVLDYRSSSGGCTTQPAAVPVSTPRGAAAAARPPGKTDGKPPYGLSTGGKPQESATCPPMMGARAACSDGRCVLVVRLGTDDD
jgi:hypothetical protein